jgi:hypothetical protein
MAGETPLCSLNRRDCTSCVPHCWFGSASSHNAAASNVRVARPLLRGLGVCRWLLFMRKFGLLPIGHALRGQFATRISRSNFEDSVSVRSYSSPGGTFSPCAVMTLQFPEYTGSSRLFALSPRGQRIHHKKRGQPPLARSLLVLRLPGIGFFTLQSSLPRKPPSVSFWLAARRDRHPAGPGPAGMRDLLTRRFVSARLLTVHAPGRNSHE